MDVLNSVFAALVDWLAHGFSSFNGWEVLAYTLVTTHITIAAVTIFLHRAQAHRALDLHADSRRTSSASGSGSPPAW